MAYIEGFHNKLIKSSSSGNFSNGSGSLVQVTDGVSPLSCIITTSGRNVRIELADDGVTFNGSNVGSGNGGIVNDTTVVFKRNGVIIASMTQHHQNNVSVSESSVPPGSFVYEDTPPGPGTYTYTVFAQGTAGSGLFLNVTSCVLQVKEV